MTENIYQRGQIYSIRSHKTNLIYIGSTVQPLHVRFGGHKKSSNKCSSREIIKYADAYIELLELFPCNSKKELNKREGYIIRQLDCINKKIEGRTQQEYNAEHKEEIAKQQAKYNAEHKEQLVQCQAKYYADHKEEIAERRKAKYKALKLMKQNEEHAAES